MKLSKRKVTESNVRAEVAAQWRVLLIAAGVRQFCFPRLSRTPPDGNRTGCRADVPSCTAAIFDADTAEVAVQWHATSDDLADLLVRLAKEQAPAHGRV